uniref:V-SNARE coiled-coil homology domain-containing protein n=1 Tax=Panagrellus redivivus TaxID=6233 RepID=A0A7E4VXF4_PANRE
MLRGSDRLSTVANALRASTSEPNLRKKQVTSAGKDSKAATIEASKPEKPTLTVPSKSKGSKSRSDRDSSDSSDTEDKNFMRADFILKFKKKLPPLTPSTSSTPVSMSISNEVPQPRPPSSAKPPPSPKTNSSSRYASTTQVHENAPPVPTPIIGFNKCVFFGKDRIVTSFLSYLRVFYGPDHSHTLRDIPHGGPISCVQVSPDFAYVVVAVDAPQGAKVVIHDAHTLHVGTANRPMREFATAILATRMCISLTNESLLLVAPAEKGSYATLALYSFEGTFLGETRVTPPTSSKQYEATLCPADDTIICTVTDNHCYLLRATTNIINVFSTIKFFDMSCHAWADDVTLAFGTNNGELRLYRETVPLEVINLKTVCDNLIGEQEDAKQAEVTQMYATDQNLIVYVVIGIVFVFPAGDLKTRWAAGRAIVINSIFPKTICTNLHMDQDNGNVLYEDTESTWLCNVRYAEAVCDNGMRLIFARHSSPVRHVAFEPKSRRFATLDERGLVLVTVMDTQRNIAHAIIEGAIGVAVLPNGHSIAVVTAEGIDVYEVLIHELKKKATVWEGGTIQAFASSQSADQLALANRTQLTVLDADTLAPLFTTSLEADQNVIKLRYSASSEYIGILTDQDAIYLVSVHSGTVLWINEFKLRFFVDIAVHEEAIFALGNKFVVVQIRDGNELDPINVHYEGVSFNTTSTAIMTTSEGFYFGTKLGSLLRVQADNIENVQMIQLQDIGGTSCLFYIASEQWLLSGHDDGAVMLTKLAKFTELEKDIEVTLTKPEDIVLCRADEFEHNKFTAKERTVERSLIRSHAKRVFDTYKQKKEQEIREMTTDFETNMKAMREKIRLMEDKCEASEAAKEETINKLKEDFKKDISEQKQFYETMINDQIKSTLEMSADHKAGMEALGAQHGKELADLRAQLEFEKDELMVKLSEFKDITLKLRKDLFESESRQKMLRQDIAATRQKYVKMINDFKLNFDNERAEFRNTTKNLKATILIIEHEKNDEVQNVRSQKQKLEALSDELAENEALFDEKNSQIEKLQERVTLLERESAMQNKLIEKLTQKTIVAKTEVDQERLCVCSTAKAPNPVFAPLKTWSKPWRPKSMITVNLKKMRWQCWLSSVLRISS